MNLVKINILTDLESLSVFEDIDIEFAKFLHRISKIENPILGLTAALVSYTLRNNNICLRMEEYADKEFPAEQDFKVDKISKQIKLPKLEDWLIQLKEFKPVVTFSDETRPLVVDSKNRIYIQRYFKYEQDLAEFFTKKIRNNKQLQIPGIPINITETSKYFKNTVEIDYQQVAVFASTVNQFTVITGSPGTGKTSVVAAILATFFQQNPEGKVGICAPTGKAAARLKESLNSEIENLCVDENIKNKIQKIEPSTIHRLLRTKYNTPHFIYNKENKLNINLLVLDEASMVSQPLMCKLFYALPEDAKVILLGDKDQLASVEEGSVFGDLCDSLPINQFSKDFCNTINKDSQLKLTSSTKISSLNTIIELNKSYRFDDKKGIGLVKSAINEGEISKVIDTSKSENDQISLFNLPQKNMVKSKIISFIKSLNIFINGEEYSLNDYINFNNVELKFRFMSSFRILCAKRNGIYGINNINRIIIEHFFDSQKKYSNGIPMMITKNDNRLKLFNGDIGIVQTKGNSTKIYFPDIKEQGKYRSFSPNQIPEHEPVFAMTIHKSQGSGFQKLLLVMPDKDSSLLTRELLYTGITRAKKYCEIWSYDSIIKKTIERVTKRDSGLKDKLSQI